MFGMGTGVTASLWLPGKGKRKKIAYRKTPTGFQALPRPAAPGGRTVIFETESIVWLRSERLAHGQASRTISTGRVRPLLSVRLPPIKVVVFDHPSGALRPGRSYLWVGLALRCIQRLSVPDLATRLCPWQDNRHTIGPSFPVLSY